jgi:hypothetical protein
LQNGDSEKKKIKRLIKTASWFLVNGKISDGVLSEIWTKSQR